MFRSSFLLGAFALVFGAVTARAQPGPAPETETPTPARPASPSVQAPSESETAPPPTSSDDGTASPVPGGGARAADEATPEPSSPPPVARPPAEVPAGYREVNSPERPEGRRNEREPRAPEPGDNPIYEPPLPAPYIYAEPPPPQPPEHVAPSTSLWLGARAGWLFPMGSLWQDGELLSGACCVYHNRGWNDFATSGPMLEVDLGARLSRTYNVFALWELGLLSDGGELGEEFGGQSSAHSHFLGLGLRFSTNADDIGILVEMALGWRQFRATWNNGTEFTATDDFFNTRIGIGADIRLSKLMSLSPMITLGGGVFSEAEWKFADGSSAGAFSGVGNGTADRAAQHVPVSLQVGLHFDAIRSKD